MNSMRQSCVLAWVGLTVGLSACSGPGSGSEAERSAGRVHEVNQPVQLESDAPRGVPGVRPQSFSGSSTGPQFSYVAAVDAPVTKDGRTLQATSFAVRGKFGYAVYMMAGLDVFGALDIINLDDPSHPVLVSTTMFPTAEFADIQVAGTTAYLGGARSDGDAGGTLEVMDVANPAHPVSLGHVALAGHTVTSLALGPTSLLATTGDNGGLVEFAIGGKSPLPKLVSTIPMANALYVRRKGDDAYVLAGSTSTSVTTVHSGRVSSTTQVASQQVAAPARLRRYQNTLVVNAQQTGLTLLDASGKSAAQHETLLGTGNGLEISRHLGFFAQGEAGIRVYDFRGSGLPTYLGHFAFPDERGSANNVRIGRIGANQQVFLSDGLGGFRIVRFASNDVDSRDTSSSDDVDEQNDHRDNEGETESDRTE